MTDAGVALAALAAIALLFFAIGAVAPGIGLDRYAARNLGHAGALLICAIGVNLVADWEPIVSKRGAVATTRVESVQVAVAWADSGCTVVLPAVLMA